MVEFVHELMSMSTALTTFFDPPSHVLEDPQLIEDFILPAVADILLVYLKERMIKYINSKIQILAIPDM